MAERPGSGRRLSRRIGQIRAGGEGALAPLPPPNELAEREPADRERAIEELRLDLYALSSILADGTVQRARRDRSSYPPYGLARSKFSEWRMLLARPEPYEEGSIQDFPGLWRAYVDTMVFHLYGHVQDLRGAGEAWTFHRLEQVLALFWAFADPEKRPRLKDGRGFLYGGLQFGTSVCVQLAEAMTRLLSGFPETPPEQKASVIGRSIRPAYRLAGMSQDDALSSYRGLLAADRGPVPPGWLDETKLSVEVSDGRPRRIDVREEDADADGDGELESRTVLGCPARVSITGGPSAIAVLWEWCAELVRDTGLLSRPLSEDLGRVAEQGDGAGDGRRDEERPAEPDGGS